MTLAATDFIGLLSICLIAVAVILCFMPVGTCAECDHCKVAKLAKERELEARTGKFYGIPVCASCGRRHDPAEHRRR
ncbi:MAG: hypothetical protein ABIV26_02840 [Candidatus Limnocylindrales bacterium]